MTESIFGSMSTKSWRAEFLSGMQLGVRHLHRMEPLIPNPGDQPVVTVTVELDREIDRLECVILEPEHLMVPLLLERTVWDHLNWTYSQVWKGTLPARADGTLVRYQIEAYPTGKADPILADGGELFSYIVGDFKAPDWSREAIIYQVFPDRYHPGYGNSWVQAQNLNDIYGGTIRGVIDHLDHIADLGFTCIWLNPFFPDTTHHGYHATDYFSVNPRMGTMDEIQELVHRVHERKMRLILDFVANHWSYKHATFQEAQADRNSPYYKWYFWKKWPHKYETYFNVAELPKVNVDHPGAREYLLKSVQFWLGEIGFDGLRLDYAPGPTHDFWTALRVAAVDAKPDVWIFGEAVESPFQHLIYAGRFHGCLDFLLTQKLRETFGFGTLGLAAFDRFLQQHDAYFPEDFSRPSFLDNHDMDRFLWISNGDLRRVKLAALCLFTLKGPPIVYYGTEVGMSQVRSNGDPQGGGMAECRQPMQWGLDQNLEIAAYFKELIKFRRAHPAIWDGYRKTVHLDEASGTYAYVCLNDVERVLIAFNLSGEKRQLNIHDPGLALDHTIVLPALSGESLTI